MTRVNLCIGLPLHNGASHLRQAVDSFLAQTYPDFQLILLDDGSTDDSGLIRADYVRNDDRVRFFRNESRTGLVPAWR